MSEIRVIGYTSRGWKKATSGRCARCSADAAWIRVIHKRSRTGESIQMSAFCQRHAEKAGKK